MKRQSWPRDVARGLLRERDRSPPALFYARAGKGFADIVRTQRFRLSGDFGLNP